MTAQTILPANSVVDSGFNVDNSCRFNNASDDSLTRSKGASETSTRTATYSFWIKIAEAVGTDMWIYSNEVANDNNRGYIQFNTDSNFRIIVGEGADTQIYFITDAEFRDFSAWSHWVISIDTTQATEANRVKIYLNGVQVTSFSTATYPQRNADLTILVGGQTNKEHIGNIHGQDAKLSAYLCEFVFIDGLQLAADQFGEFDSDSGIWKPIDVSGITLGNQGYYLDFKDSSALGNSVGNSNNFTVNNLTAIDQSTDTCTNNFATLNPLDIPTANKPNTFSQGNLEITNSADENRTSFSSIGVQSGKWYFEAKFLSGEMKQYIGISKQETVDRIGASANSYGFAGENARKWNNNSYGSYGSTASTGDIIMVAFDADNGIIWVGKNGSWFGSATQSEIENSTTTNAMYSSITIDDFFMMGFSMEDSNIQVNFGSPMYAISSGNTDGDGFGNFEYAVPSGYYSLNTKNLAEYG